MSSATAAATDTTKTRNEGFCAVIVDADEDKKSRELLARVGFDPNKIHKECRINGWSTTPMIYFSAIGNLKMIQYLVSRGADCRKTNTNGGFPMYYAAAWGHIEVVQWLFHHGGAKEDIRKVLRSGQALEQYILQSTACSPLHTALLRGYFDVVHWLILNGALASRDDVDICIIDDIVMRRDLGQHDSWSEDKRLPILSWAQDAITTHDMIQLFLKGTILSSSSFRRHPNNEYATRSKRMRLSSTAAASSSSPLVIFKGKSGILELISKYVGVPQPREIRIFRQVMVLLPAFIEDVPFDLVDEDSDY